MRAGPGSPGRQVTSREGGGGLDQLGPSSPSWLGKLQE